MFLTKKRFNEEVNHRIDEDLQRKEFYAMRDKLDFLDRSVKDLTMEMEDLVKYTKDRNSVTNNESSYIPEYCKACPNHPSNGGSGICYCTLGSGNYF